MKARWYIALGSAANVAEQLRARGGQFVNRRLVVFVGQPTEARLEDLRTVLPRELEPRVLAASDNGDPVTWPLWEGR